MCDTLVTYTKNGMFFGKNSDRDPDEVQNILLQPAADHSEGEPLKCTYISIPQVKHTHEVLLSIPYWIWGAEIGVNQFGVCIGNESLFTKVPPLKEPKYLIGMDYLRLGLERATTAKEALNVILQLLEIYGQGGNCGHSHEFYYNNSYLIADGKEAYVLETIGKMWAWKRITTYWSISNGISITTDYDATSSDLISYALKKKWAKSAEGFNFQKVYTEPLMSWAARFKSRQACTFTPLQNKQANIAITDLFSTLRSHGANDHKVGFNPINSNWISVCAHASGVTSPSQSTNSLVVWRSPEGKMYVFSTASSTPCTSIYKLVYGTGLRLPSAYKPGSKKSDLAAHWWQAERFNRVAWAHYNAIQQDFMPERNTLEAILINKVTQHQVSQTFVEESYAQANALMDRYLKKYEHIPTESEAQKGFKYWNKLDKKTGLSSG